MPAVFVHLLPKLITPGALRGGLAVVLDVLRATTVMVHALAAGCEAVVPCAEIDEALGVAANLPAGRALLGGERGGLPIEGFDLGNSPADYAPDRCRGKTLVMTTTNGTRAILASLDAERVFIGAFVNRTATVEAVAATQSSRGEVHLVCSGTEGYISLEDTLLAGAMVSGLARLGVEPQNDEARIARRAWDEVGFGPAKDIGLARVLASGRGGQNVRRIHLEADIDDAARVDRFDLAAELRREPLGIVPAGPASTHAGEGPAKVRPPGER